jgi:tetratricopeptide (TPR) repeat protein
MSQHTGRKGEGVDPAALNNDGVTWMLMGKNREAVVSFKQALIALKASLVQIPDHIQTPPPARPSAMYVSVDLPVCEERYYIYSRAMIFPSCYEGGAPEKANPLHSAMVLFNIALAYHVRCLVGSDDRALRDASYFYNVSLQILSSAEAHVPERVFAPLKLACLNNLAIAHYEVGEAREADSILDYACSLLPSSIVPFDECQDTFDQEDFDGIALNAVTVKWTFAAPCA